MIIGYLSDAYPEKRCIIDKIHDNSYQLIKIMPKAENDKVQKLFLRIINHYKWKFGIKNRIWDKTAVIDEGTLFENDADVIHLFNTILCGGVKWCTSFESQTPVCDDLIGRDWERSEKKDWKIGRTARKMLRECAKPNCLALIAISQSAYNIQKEMIQRVSIPVEQKKALLKKLTVVHPPQKALISPEEIAGKYADLPSPVHFVFVGHNFFLKGGMEVLEVLGELSKEYDIRLTIISKLQFKDYASASNENEYQYCMNLIKSSEWIDWYESLENDKVIDLMKKAHVGLLPTLADTYGYSVLEMQACGCPVITTNIRALCEINNDECGWICEIPHNQFGEAVYATYSDEQKHEIRKILQKNLRQVCLSIVSNPTIIEHKAFYSVARVESVNNPKKIAEQLRIIYKNEALC